MTSTKEDIASRAFILLGANVVSDFTDGLSREADIANTLYEEMVQAELGSYPWNFAKASVQLSRDAEAPLGKEWDAKYRIDALAITVRGLLVEGHNIEYEIQEDFALCNATEDDTVIMEYIGRPDESKWPAYFQTAMVYKLATDFGASISRDGDLVKEMRELYVFQQRRARAMDSQSETSRPLRTRRLITSRY